jgi:transcriptional regulator with XRE-family HTH domain
VKPFEDSEPHFPDEEEIARMLETMHNVMGDRLARMLEEAGVEPTTMMRFSSLAERLKETREGKGLSPDEIGRELDVAPGVVIGIEHAAIGELDPRIVSDYVALMGLEEFFRAWANRFKETAGLLESGKLNRSLQSVLAPGDSFKKLTPEDHEYLKALDSMDDEFVDQLQELTGEFEEDGSDPVVYQFKITLDGIKPPIWRRLQTPSDFTLESLSDMIQTVMGWEGGHLHAFEIDGEVYGPSDPADWDDEALDECDYGLDDLVLSAKTRFKYRYDFGDDWSHTVVLEKILPWKPEDGPVCVTGQRACPPEDCGGIWGYQDLLATLADPKHPAHAERREWMGGSVPDPERFSLERVNLKLAAQFPPDPESDEDDPSAMN